VVFIQFGDTSASISRILLFVPGLPTGSEEREKWNQNEFDPVPFGATRKMDLVFIDIGELQLTLAWNIRMIAYVIEGAQARRSRRS
jgi:hypothetical protein